MPLVSTIERETRTARRFRVILRGDDFLVPAPEDDRKPERMGFYVVRTAVADNLTMAGKLALFDFEAEMRVAQKLARCFLETGSLAVEEARPLGDNEEDVASDLLFYPMT